MMIEAAVRIFFLRYFWFWFDRIKWLTFQMKKIWFNLWSWLFIFVFVTLSLVKDYLELDDDALPNGAVSPFSTSGKETTVSTAVADKTISAVETAVLEKPPGSSVLMPSKSFTIDGKPQVRTADGSKVEKNVDVTTSITSSVSDPIFKPISEDSIVER